MITIKREMNKTDTIQTNYPETQVSFNSDFCLTVRKYDPYDKDKDEIIIFTREETEEVVKLFKNFKKLCRIESDSDLPF